MPPSLLQLRDWARQHWPHLALGALVVVSFLAGRFSAPTKTVTQESTKEAKEQQVATTSTQTETKATTQATDTATKHVVKHVVETFPDGRRLDATTDTTGTDAKAVKAEKVSDVAQQVRVETRVEYRDHEVTKTVETARPRLRLGVLAGVQPLRLTAPVVWGAEAQVRVLGPAWIGAWALTSGVAGLGVAVEF